MKHDFKKIIEVHQKVWELVKPFWRPNSKFGHGISHAQATYKWGLYISSHENANPFVVGAACYFMDSGLSLKNGREGHIERSIEIAHEIIPNIPELEKHHDLIIKCILKHEAEIPLALDDELEIKVVRDSDLLDRLGKSGIAMTLKYGQWISRELFYPLDPFCNARQPELNGYTFDYLKYLTTLIEKLSTNTGIKMGHKKQVEFLRFFNEFQVEFRKNKDLGYSDAYKLIKKIK